MKKTVTSSERIDQIESEEPLQTPKMVQGYSKVSRKTFFKFSCFLWNLKLSWGSTSRSNDSGLPVLNKVDLVCEDGFLHMRLTARLEQIKPHARLTSSFSRNSNARLNLKVAFLNLKARLNLIVVFSKLERKAELHFLKSNAKFRLRVAFSNLKHEDQGHIFSTQTRSSYQGRIFEAHRMSSEAQLKLQLRLMIIF